MAKYIARKIFNILPILFGITLVTFLLFNVVGGSPALQAAGKHATAERIAEIEREMGLDKPLPIQYLNYVASVFQFDFGRSWASQQKISTIVLSGIGPSLSLTVPAFLVTLFLSITLALTAAYFRGHFIDRALLVICLIGMSVSSLIYILGLQYFLSYKLDLFPISGWDASLTDRIPYLALPWIIMVALSLGGSVLFYRTIFLDEMGQDYVRTARAKGLSVNITLFKHVLRNALIPILTIVIMDLPSLVLGALLLESFFGIPGLGGLMFQAIQNADFPVVKAMVFVMSLLYLAAQIALDITYALVDPKVQLK